MTDDFKVIQTGQRCRNLQSKGLYINAGLSPGEEAVGDGHFWCGLNQESYGPDNRLCDGESCTDSTRACYEAP